MFFTWIGKILKASTADTACVDSTSSMPKCTVKSVKGHSFAKDKEGHCAVSNRGVFSEKSPRSPLSRGSPPFIVMSPESDFFDLIIDGTIDTSIEQMYLYHSVCEMQSSDHSSSRCSFISYGEESRIDSELRFLAGWKRGDVNEWNGENNQNSGEEKDKVCEVESGFEVGKTSLSGKGFHGRWKKLKKASLVAAKSENVGKDQIGESYLGPYLLKQARDVIVSGNNTQKALELAIRAMKSFEACVGAKSSLPLVMCLHVVAALYCRLGKYTEAICLLERAIEIPVMDLGLNHALAKFAGCMQLGDTYAGLGQIEKSILLYAAGLEIQRQVLGENDSRFGDTCRYLAKAYIQVLQFDEAGKLCSMALDIHKIQSSDLLKEGEDRQLMGLILEAKGDYKGALEHYVLARAAMAGNARNADVVAVDCSIGDAYSSLGQYDEAILAYQKALKTAKLSRGDSDQSSIALVFVRLADLSCKTGNFIESKWYCGNALKIYAKPTPGMLADDVANGLTEMSSVYVSMNELDEAIQMLQKAIDAFGNAARQHISMVAGIEAQMGALHYITGHYSESYNCLKNAIGKLRTMGEIKTALYGVSLNQMGLTCLQLVLVSEAVDAFEEARIVLERECGSCHADMLGVYTNLAGTYDAIGR